MKPSFAKCCLLLMLLVPVLAMGQKRGIDVSKYQGTINWVKVAKTKKVSYAYVKATEGTTIQDAYYKKNVKNARAAGIPVGSYHLYSSKTSAYQQFANFKSVVKKSEQDLIPVLDIEAYHNKNLNMARVDKLLELMEAEYGAKPMIYTSERVYIDRFQGGKYKNYKFFIANYKRYPQGQLTLWQYTQTGKLSGISGYVDFGEFAAGKDVDDIRLDKPKKKKHVVRTKMVDIDTAKNASASRGDGDNDDFDW